ncbi:hypothetical protein JG687_00018188 [Phytophthora cactorum]|uniref:Uncharacterized protein n=1 Tax=Phytophthora cactorum TaxID=29920 RepID=A0A8T1TPL5_9STRA|nr:hypothetical protein JG687_00018188 [Phytophthora cactorum]
MLARESAEQLLKISSSTVESLEAENRPLRSTNIRVDALLQKMNESTGLHTRNLELPQAEVAERDTVIHAMERRLAKEREAFKAAVAANTQQTRQLHAILIKAQKGKFVDADTAHSLEDLQKRNTHRLHSNRVVRSHVSLVGMTASELNLADLELDQDTFVALQRIQAEAAGLSDPHAVPAALEKAAHQSQVWSPRFAQTKSLEAEEASEDSSVVAVICSFPIKSKFASHKFSLTVAFSISVSHEVVDRSTEVSVADGV